jgi:hypothetical protein
MLSMYIIRANIVERTYPMKAVTEFSVFTLNKAILAKNTLTTEGKTTEEVQVSLGETFKLEGDKLTYFMNSIEIAASNPVNLKRVLVLKLNEGETAPAKSTQIEDCCYLAETLILVAPKAVETKKDGKFSGNSKKGAPGAPKTSPWGMSPEEKANKNKKAPATAKA